MSNQDSNDIKKYRFIYHFLPHPHHKKRAGVLSHNAFLIYSFSLILFLLVFKVLPVLVPGVLGYASNIDVSNLLKHTNERRAEVGLAPLKMNNTLSNAAYKKAKDMFKEGYWAHVSPKGTKPWDFILNEGYDYIYAGENLAKNFQNSKDVVNAWYNSPSHRDNLLSANYEEIGFAIVNGVLDGYETTIVVQMFGKSRVAPTLASNTPLQPVVVEEEVIPEPVLVEEPTPVVVQVPSTDLATLQQVESEATKDDFIDVRTVSSTLVVLFGGFLVSMLSLDIWYSKKQGIFKLTGHTAAHLAFLLVALFSILFTVFPGDIL